MGRTRDLSFVLWSALAACGNSGTNHLADGGVDSAVDAPAGVNFPIAVALISECGATAPTDSPMTVSNTSTTDLVIASVTTEMGFTVTSPLPLTIPAGMMETMMLRAPAAVIGTDIAGSTVTGSLTATTNKGTYTVSLVSTINGANLELQDGSGSAVTSLTFVGTAEACPAPQAVFIKNTGNEAITIGTSAGSHFAIGGFASGDVSGGAMFEQDIRPFEQGFCMDTQGISYQVTGPLCSNVSGVELTASYNMGGASSCFCS